MATAAKSYFEKITILKIKSYKHFLIFFFKNILIQYTTVLFITNQPITMSQLYNLCTYLIQYK